MTLPGKKAKESVVYLPEKAYLCNTKTLELWLMPRTCIEFNEHRPFRNFTKTTDASGRSVDFATKKMDTNLVKEKRGVP